MGILNDAQRTAAAVTASEATAVVARALFGSRPPIVAFSCLQRSCKNRNSSCAVFSSISFIHSFLFAGLLGRLLYRESASFDAGVAISIPLQRVQTTVGLKM